MIEQQFNQLKEICSLHGTGAPTCTPISSGAILISVPDVGVGAGWNREKAEVLFLAPAGYPAAQPDCFWVAPGGFRLTNG
ncbi:MAG TPA: hypothetical protein VK629_10410, partial [Steroidobacteraceae bacterium]|nr:hypothetical protein [Steroidobacteraceae bacterium]